MSVTSINPSVALIVIDMQQGIVGRETVDPVAGVTQNVVRLADAFRERSHPVVLVTVGWRADGGDVLRTRSQVPGPSLPLPAGFSDVIPELRADPSRDILIRKHQWGAFYGTGLDAQLRRRAITDIVLCGISTSIGVESTARSAWEHGYNVTFATDAMTDMNADAQDRAISIIFPRIGELGTTSEILAKLP